MGDDDFVPGLVWGLMGGFILAATWFNVVNTSLNDETFNALCDQVSPVSTFDVAASREYNPDKIVCVKESGIETSKSVIVLKKKVD